VRIIAVPRLILAFGVRGLGIGVRGAELRGFALELISKLKDVVVYHDLGPLLAFARSIGRVCSVGRQPGLQRR
jgi:hypothetical protein